MRMLRTQNFYFEFTQQFSSVSTEQSQTGVKSLIFKIRENQFRRSQKRKTPWTKYERGIHKWLFGNPRMEPSGNRLRDLLNFESPSKIYQIAIFELASFWGPVAPRTYKPIQDVDVLEDSSMSGIHPRSDPESTVFAETLGGTVIGPSEFDLHYFLVILHFKAEFHLRIDQNEHFGW